MTTNTLESLARGKSDRRRRRAVFVLLMACVAVTVAEGSRRRPADPTRTIALRGDVPLTEEQRSVLKVATFNVHGGRGRDHRLDLTRTAAVFPFPPDVVGLNEVRGTWNERLGHDQAAQLGALLGMRSAFVPTEIRWWHDHFGNALLTRFPIQNFQRIPLAGTRDKAFRTALLSQMRWNDQTVQLLTVHVDSQSDRQRQLEAVIALFLGLHPPAVLMGDLNSTRDDPALQTLLARSDVAGAFPEDVRDSSGRLPIDWIVARGFRCRSLKLVDNDASDHPAVIAELELLPEPDPARD